MIAIARIATLFAVLMAVCYVSAEPEPTPEPSPVYYPWDCRPPTYNRPACCASTTTVGALVVPTLATVHSKGRARPVGPCSRCPSCY